MGTKKGIFGTFKKTLLPFIFLSVISFQGRMLLKEIWVLVFSIRIWLIQRIDQKKSKSITLLLISESGIQTESTVYIAPTHYWDPPQILLFLTWNSPYLCEEVSIPVPITNPPTVKSSNSGKIGIVQPKLFKARLNCPIVTKGSHFTVLFD